MSADAIEELVEAIEMSADNLVATVECYNELFAAGEDTDFGKRAYRLFPVDEPPCYAARYGCRGSHGMDGLIINGDMQVLDENLNVVPGQHAAGDKASCMLSCSYIGTAPRNAAAWPSLSPAMPAGSRP